MDTVTYPAPEVREALASWFEHRVDVSVSADVARVCRVPAVPVALAVDGDGRILGRREGFVEPQGFVEWLATTRKGQFR